MVLESRLVPSDTVQNRDPNVRELEPDWRLGPTFRIAPSCIDAREKAFSGATQLPEAPEPGQCASRAMQVPNRQRSRRTQAEGAPPRTLGDPSLRSRTRGFALSW